jgi:putative ABC transport system ATP-binding protein
MRPGCATASPTGRPSCRAASGNLDSNSSGEILSVLRSSVDTVGQTVVMVTHDPRAAAIADRLLFLSDGQIVKDLAGGDENEIVDTMKSLY